MKEPHPPEHAAGVEGRGVCEHATPKAVDEHQVLNLTASSWQLLHQLERHKGILRPRRGREKVREREREREREKEREKERETRGRRGAAQLLSKFQLVLSRTCQAVDCAFVQKLHCPNCFSE